MSRVKWFWVALIPAIMLVPSLASAQAISGTVTDTTGAVIPGVTVEASSPALIERTRVAVTDEAGRYSIVNLRPGVYSVKFTLEGFNTVQRDGITLTSDFTAPVNAQMKVGSVSEVITVTGASPLVDVTSVSKTQTVTTEMLQSLPLGNRTIQDILQTTVPGTGSTTFGTNTYRGSADTVTTVDGNRVTWLGGPGPGASSQTLSPSAYQEYTVTTGVDNLDTATPGMKINVVPKDGGNEFKGSTFLLYSGDGWSSNNVPDKYTVAPFNFTVPAKEALNLDINPTFGGPILRDKLWFQNTFHFKRNDSHVLGWYSDANPNPFIYTPNLSASPIAKQLSVGGGTRLTWQASQRDKIAGFYDDEYNHWGNFFAVAGNSPDAATNYYSPRSRNAGVKWSRTQSSKLLIEAGASAYRLDLFNDLREPMLAWSTRRGSAEPGFVEPAIPAFGDMEIISGLNFGNQFGIGSQPAGGFTGNGSSSSVSKTVTANASVTYITGSHNFKAGMTFLHGTDLAQNRDIADVVLIVNNGLPARITASLPSTRRNTVDGDFGFYAQDAWTVRRLTLKGGLRLDWLRTSYPDQVLPASVWLPTEQNCGNNPDFCGQSVLNWRDLSPRVGATYDVFGNGKTAIRGGFARYVAGETIGTTDAVNPLSGLVRQTGANWDDVDGNHNIYNGAGDISFDEINATTSTPGRFQDPSFGTSVITTHYDPDTLTGFGKRGYTWEYDLGIDHEIFSRLSASLTYYHRSDGNILATDNRNLGLSDYDPFCLVAPTDPRLGAVSGQNVCGLFDLKPASAAKAADNFVTFSDNLGAGKAFTNINKGYNITLTSRLPRGAFVSGGIDLRSLVTDDCGFPMAAGGFFGTVLTETPEARFCRNEGAYNLGARLTGSYVLPYGVQASVAYQAVRGPNVIATWTATNADLAAAAAAGVPTQLGRPFSSFFGSRDVTLIEPNQQYLPYRHNFDMRFSKIFNFNRYRLTAGVDLYNAFNSAGINSIRTAYPTVDYGQATGLVAPRQLRLNGTFDF